MKRQAQYPCQYIRHEFHDRYTLSYLETTIGSEKKKKKKLESNREQRIQPKDIVISPKTVIIILNVNAPHLFSCMKRRNTIYVCTEIFVCTIYLIYIYFPPLNVVSMHYSTSSWALVKRHREVLLLVYTFPTNPKYT
jgi:hypothetical protein